MGRSQYQPERQATPPAISTTITPTKASNVLALMKNMCILIPPRPVRLHG
jgi:hypothetical protein